jgi:peptide/nickel transport system permease protein
VYVYVGQRILALVPVLLVVAVVVFSLLRLTPGDPAALMLGDTATVDQIQQLHHQLGLDQPVPVQFVLWIAQAAQGNLGQSLYFNEGVTQAIASHIEPTVMLTLYALLFAIGLGTPLGVLAALRQGGAVDRVLMLISLVGIAAPSFLVGLLLILVFAVTLRWLPAAGYVPLSGGLWANFQSLILPACALGLGQLALVARMTRTSVLEVLNADFVRTAYAKGLPHRLVLLRHVLRTALLPIVTIVGLSFAVLMGGTVVTETLFSLPGIGRLVVEAVLRRDYPVIQGAVLYVTTAIVVVNLLVDLLYLWIDPRITY